MSSTILDVYLQEDPSPPGAKLLTHHKHSAHAGTSNSRLQDTLHALWALPCKDYANSLSSKSLPCVTVVDLAVLTQALCISSVTADLQNIASDEENEIFHLLHLDLQSCCSPFPPATLCWIRSKGTTGKRLSLPLPLKVPITKYRSRYTSAAHQIWLKTGANSSFIICPKVVNTNTAKSLFLLLPPD